MRWILMVTLLAGFLSACANVSRFEKEALTAHGEQLDGFREPLYYLIRIDLSKAVDSSMLNISLKLTADSAPIALSELSPELVGKYLPPYAPPPQWPEEVKGLTVQPFLQELKAETVYKVSVYSQSVC